jgi:hypothetical protein
MWNQIRPTRTSYPSNKERPTRTKFIAVMRDHSRTNSSKKIVETREEILRFQKESLVLDLIQQKKLRCCKEMVHKHGYLT